MTFATNWMFQIVSVVIFCGWVLSGLAAQDAGKDLKDGRELYIDFGCHYCHGYQGYGAATGPQLAPDPMPYEGFAGAVRKPYNTMPAYPKGSLSEEQLRRIYSYLIEIPAPRPVGEFPELREHWRN